MNKRSMYITVLAVLLLSVVTVTTGVWLTGGFSHGDPSLDQGCYCHNNGIAIYVNGTGDGNGGLFFGPFKAGTSFHFYVSTNNVQATGIVPGLQQWFSNQTDNAKFTFSPVSVTDGSAQDRSPTAGNITALYTITTPSTAGMYTLTLYAQGSEMQPILVQVTGGSTSTTSTTHSTTSTSTTSASTTTPITTTSTSRTTTTTQPTTTSTSKTSGPVDSLKIATNAQNYSASTTLIITGTLAPAPAAGTAVVVQIENPAYTTVVYDNNVTVAADGTFSYTVSIVANSSDWVPGTYTLSVTAQEPAPLTAVSQFFYTPYLVSTTSTSSTVGTVTIFSTETTTVGTVTTTTTQTTTTVVGTVTSFKTTTVTGPALTTITTTISGPTTTTTAPGSTTTTTTTATTIATTTAPGSTVTSTAPASTLTSTATQISTSTVTQTNSAIPSWAYAAMAILLLAGLAVGYVVKRPPTRQN
ncbi:MAG: hypothetical protein ABSF83_05385 [Nitrososphaerales archaeon]